MATEELFQEPIIPTPTLQELFDGLEQRETLIQPQIVGAEIQSGSGTNSYQLNSQGLYLGGDTFASSPFSVTMGGAIKGTSGHLGGWALGSTTLTGGNTILSSSGIVTVGSEDDVAILSSVDATYRIWAGDATAADAPFRVTKDGVLFATGATISGTITATALHIPDEDITANSFHVDEDGNTWWGATHTNFTSNNDNATAYVLKDGSAKFQDAIISGSSVVGGWYAKSTTLGSGAVDASANVFLDAGNSLMRLGPTSGNYLKLDGANIELESSNYVSGPLGAGFHIDTDLAEFGNIRARGKISTSVFEKDSISSVGGQLIVANADILASDMTALDASTLTITGDTTFAVNDILVIGDGTDLEYLRVTDDASAPTYTVTRDLGAAYSANTNPVWKKGTAVSVFGSSDGSSAYSGGWLFMKGAGTNAPYYAVVRRTGLGATDFTENVRIGNLNGFLGYSTDIFGMGIGETGNNLTYDPTGGFSIKAGDGNVTLDDGGIQITEATEAEETYAQTRSVSWLNPYNERGAYLGSVTYELGGQDWRSATFLVTPKTASETLYAAQLDIVAWNGGDPDTGNSSDAFLSLVQQTTGQPDVTLAATAAHENFTNANIYIHSDATGDNVSGTSGVVQLRAGFTQETSPDTWAESFSQIYLRANYTNRDITFVTEEFLLTNTIGESNPFLVFVDSENASNYISFTVPTLSGDTEYTLPAADGSAGDVLKTDGSGNLGWLGAATDAVRGTVELATNAETLTGTDTTRAVTPAGLMSTFLPPQGFMINGKISVSVSANDLIVAIKTLAGNDPSSTDPVYVRIGDTVRTITAALSKTLADGTNWFNAGGTGLATYTINYFVYLIWNTTPATDIVDMGFARFPSGDAGGDFSTTSTNEKYLAHSNADEPQATDEAEIVGRFSATLSAGAGYTWSNPINVINRPIYETDWLDWDSGATASGVGTMTFTSTTGVASYKLIGNKECRITGYVNGTTGGTAAAAIATTLPFMSEQASARNYQISCFVRDATSGTNISGFAFIVDASPDYIRFSKYDGSNYGLGAGRQAFFSGHYIYD